ncbi:MAG: ORF6N domain-containing protein [Patescibacteria group bacterium]
MKDSLVSKNLIENKIFVIRDEKVMLDKDLALLYGVATKVLNQAVKRNIDRFPVDFMFQLTLEESRCLRSQIVTLKRGSNIKYLPYVFTEHGILMLSSILKSKKAVQTNIAIMRVFTLMRKLSFSYELLDKRLSVLEKRYSRQDVKIGEIMEAIQRLIYGNQNVKRKEIKGFTA